MGSVIESKLACPDVMGCGSSDAFHKYDDGSGFCFSCGKYFHSDGTEASGGHSKVSNDTQEFNPVDVSPISLSKRGIDGLTSGFFGYGQGTLSDGTPVQVANYYKNGVLVAQHTRDRDKNFMWLGRPAKAELYGQHKWGHGTSSKFETRLIITEGEIDCLSISQVLRNRWACVSIPSGVNDAVNAVSRNIDFVESFDKVIIAFDNDEQGRKATQEVCTIISPNKAHVLSLPDDYKDANEMLLAGKAKELSDRLWQPAKWKPDGVYSLDEMEEEFFNQPPIEAIDFPSNMPKLNEMLDRNQRTRLYMWTAGSGVGKSTVVQSLAESIEHSEDRSLGVIALEESRNFTLLRYVAMEMSLSIKDVRALLDSKDPEAIRQVREAYGRLRARGKIHLYDHFGSKEVGSILSTIRYLVVGCGCTDIILDHISIVVSGLSSKEKTDERLLIDELMTELQTIIQQYSCTIHAIVHLKRPENGKCWTRGRETALTALRGSGALEQLSDAVMGVERDLQGSNPNVLQIRVLKNRPNGVTGIADVLEYSQADGKLHNRTDMQSINDDGHDSGPKFVDESQPMDDSELDF
jgi:twinkle protein